MELIATSIPEVFVVKPKVFGDHRGYFFESYNSDAMNKLGITACFVQDNESYTAKKATIRGLHFQNEPAAQSKLVRVTRGAVMDVAVDMRKGSPSYLRWVAVELSEDNKQMLYIPRGFAHGFVTLTDDVVFNYKVDNYYSPQNDRSIRFDSEEIGVNWGVANPILSDKDRNAPSLADSDCNFVFRGKI